MKRMVFGLGLLLAVALAGAAHASDSAPAFTGTVAGNVAGLATPGVADTTFQAVPEPPSSVMGLMAVVVFVALRRRRAKAVKPPNR